MAVVSIEKNPFVGFENGFAKKNLKNFEFCNFPYIFYGTSKLEVDTPYQVLD